jgi:GT2 family glycosyltransferase/2-polyprenyl-3-methyl-5-hydroxy-6-metoxy-1,4-benzoquinol methylase/glycosyltransferase involved in cell wall biosynthesis
MKKMQNQAPPVAERYTYDIDMSTQNAAAEVIRLTGRNKRVLELGPGPGTILNYLSVHSQCIVSAVELDQQCVQALKPICETVVKADLDQSDWIKSFDGQQFDVIVAADVLEHLRDPMQCLMNARELLAPEGYLVVSIPNVGHNSVLASLFSGRFPYQSRGLLDRTHLRFFTRHDFETILLETGFLATSWKAIKMSPSQAELGHHWLELTQSQQAILNENPYGNDYQYVVKAFSSSEAGTLARIESINEELRSMNVRLNEELQELKESLKKTQDTVQVAHEKISQQVVLVEKQESHYIRLLNQSQIDLQILQENTDSQKLRIEELVKKLQDADRRIEDLWASTSWRYTAPLRYLKKKFINMRNRRFRNHLRLIYSALPRPLRTFVDKTGITFSVRNLASKSITANAVSIRFDHIGAHFNQLETNPFSGFKTDGAPLLKEDVFFWGVIDWRFRFQRPQQLALGFQKSGHRIFYISSELINDKEPGFQVEAISNYDNVFQIRFHANGAPPIYGNTAHGTILHQLRQGLARLLQCSETGNAISIIQHPYWLPLARSLPQSHMAYDCMDHHEGFGNSSPEIIAAERALMREADTLIVTSDWLFEIAKKHNENIHIVRNACEFDHFNQRPASPFQDPKQRKVIGYFGAIADWFDCSLIENLAASLPDCLILLIGQDTCNAAKRFSKFKNISMIGEIPYQMLPHYLYGFDICILPFQIISLTLATNPVKVYEYMCSGKPIVSVKLPELIKMEDLLYLAEDERQFIHACTEALKEPSDAHVRLERIQFASQQTWVHRALEFEAALEMNSPPLVSIVVVTYNNLDLTQLCLASIDERTSGVRYEIIIVDNASSDGTPMYLQQFANNRQDVHILLNEDNLGFSKANNQGLAVTKGDYLVVLNNDTVVTQNWAIGLIRHCRKDSTIGLIGPVTNNIGNEAKINISYESLIEMPKKAHEYTIAHLGEEFAIHTLAFFCVMITRQAYQQVGGLDEAFGLGFFEDDDYCRRIEQAGFRIVCADDVFIHHNLSASFNKLGQERKQELFLRNKMIYESKWGKWLPHSYRN